MLGSQAEAGARHAADEDGSDDEEGGEGGSKRKKRLEARMHIGSLKQAAPRPDVVEIWDVTSTDPRLLVWLKVPRLRPHPQDGFRCHSFIATVMQADIRIGQLHIRCRAARLPSVTFGDAVQVAVHISVLRKRLFANMARRVIMRPVTRAPRCSLCLAVVPEHGAGAAALVAEAQVPAGQARHREAAVPAAGLH